jgi:hypothetical protein
MLQPPFLPYRTSKAEIELTSSRIAVRFLQSKIESLFQNVWFLWSRWSRRVRLPPLPVPLVPRYTGSPFARYAVLCFHNMYLGQTCRLCALAYTGHRRNILKSALECRKLGALPVEKKDDGQRRQNNPGAHKNVGRSLGKPLIPPSNSLHFFVAKSLINYKILIVG